MVRKEGAVMPKFLVTSPDGQKWEIEAPEGATEAQAIEYAKSQAVAQEQPQQSLGDRVGGAVKDTAAGVMRGFNRAVGTAGDALSKVLPDSPMYAKQREQFGAFNAGLERDTLPFKVGDIAGQVLVTAPVGGAIAAPLKGVAPALSQSLATGGLRAGGLTGAKGIGTRMLGGAVTGGSSVGLVSPDQAGTGAVIGAATPAALQLLGRASSAVGGAVRGPKLDPRVIESAKAARSVGYVIPPTQVKPSLMNRALEGLSGKITTAQNASARNQPITNELAKKAIGADELTEAGLQAVRDRANASYSALAEFGSFQADDAYREALGRAAGAKVLPGIVNKDVDDLVGALSAQSTLDAQQTIESIKRLRFEASANKAAMDPAKKAFGKTQNSIANAMEDLIERNLKAAEQPQLLQSYRDARKTLAKVYDVEGALNASTGNVDAAALANKLKKGRPLTGELRTVADFARQFPKAVQTPERMGSLPQVSPLDFGALGTVSAATGNPGVMAGLLARPAARSAVLSNRVQNRLVTPPSRGLLVPDELGLLPYRAFPLIGSDQ